jgi:hypothetical protein
MIDTRTFIKEVVQNLPEYSQSLKCVSWKYDECKFKFYDDEESEFHEVDLEKLCKGYDILKDLWKNKKLFFYGINTEEEFEDAGQWDAEIMDALIQCSIFGEVIYG